MGGSEPQSVRAAERADGPLSVLMVSTSYPASEEDWAGRFIYQLVEAMSRRSDIELHLWAPPGPRPAGVHQACTEADSRWLQQLMREGGIARQVRRGLRGLPLILGLVWRLWRLGRRQRDRDLLHVHWLQNALPLLSSARPTLISILGTDFALLQRPAMARLARFLIGDHQPMLAPNAPWMCAGLEQSLELPHGRIRCVPFGVDRSWFEMQRRPWPSGPRDWLVVVRVTRAKLGPLLDWGQSVTQRGDRLHLFGPMQEDIDLPGWLHYHGPTHPAALLQEWFPKAAGLISLSQHDEGRPQVILEAMAAGLPVIASPLPAHRELIQHRINGYLVDTRADFDGAVSALGDEQVNISTGRQARSWAAAQIGSWDDTAARYVEAYRLLASPGRKH